MKRTPSLPYLQPSGPYADPAIKAFTKRLIFSSWTMVPRAISTLVSYAAEREIVSAQTGQPAYRNTAEGRAPRARLLEFSKSDGRLTGMPVFGILYPSFALAELGDPLSLARSTDGKPPSRDEAVATVAVKASEKLDDVKRMIASGGVPVPEEGPVDERWYWAGPLWLDWLEDEHAADQLAALRSIREFRSAFLANDGDGDDGGRFWEHLAEARDFYKGEGELGRMPDDLHQVLAVMALGAPGPVALRALTRVSGNPLTELVDRRAACSVAWALRTLFNGSEATELVRSQTTGDRYWQRVLEYSIAGNLQAVLDEFAAVLLPAGGHREPGAASTVESIAKDMRNVISLRTVNYGVTRIDVDRGRITTRPANLRANFALRLGAEASEEGMLRESEVRDAFNSPFWPFVLATTSAGQEGLDFHHYCHAVVHWNLPGNPVDLEQREGRVHRFMGHAVRRNVARRHGDLGRRSDGNPWADLFTRAERDREVGENEIQPWWIYVTGNGSVIERYVPALPLSRDRARAEQLRRAVGLYRLAFGQPRQDELLAYLGSSVDPDLLDRLANELRIDLTPPVPTEGDAKV